MRAAVCLLLPLSLGACVSQSAFDDLAAERDMLAVKVGELEDEVSESKESLERLEDELDAARAQTEAGRERLAKLEAARTALDLDEGQELQATLRTRLGAIECELWPEIAPVTVLNFVQLAEGGREWKDPVTGAIRTDPLYPGTVFHRVIPDFMIQGGDPKGNGTGGPGYVFEDEVTPAVRFDEPGRLAMANRGPRTNGSQFFITDSTPRHLDGRHTIFGQCELDVVREIISQPLKSGGGRQPSQPEDPVVIEAIDITRG